MRSNIDLTEGRDFPERSRIPSDAIGRTLFKVFNIPWSLKPITSDLDFDRSDELFPTGTKSQIKSRLHTKRVCSGNYCDRCGASLKIIPWSNLYGLCSRCDAQLTLQYGSRRSRIPWRGRD